MLTCKDRQYTVTGCHTNCIVKLPCECSVQAAHYYIGPRLCECVINTSDITKQHTVNLAVLQEFFNEDSLQDIVADSTFEKPQQMQIQHFQIFGSFHLGDTYLQTDSQLIQYCLFVCGGCNGVLSTRAKH